MKKLQDVVFSKQNNGKTVEEYKTEVSQDFSKFKKWIAKKQAERSHLNTFRP